jgi:uncharacterized protein (DUF433 family)
LGAFQGHHLEETEEITMFERITIDPKVYHGEPCIRGMRIPVHLVVSLVAAGMTVQEIIAEYPDLKREDIKAALEYAAYVTREQVIPLKVPA